MDLQRLKEASLVAKLKLVIILLALAVSGYYIFSDSDNNVMLISSGLYFLAAILSLFTIKKPIRFINMSEVILWLSLGVIDINFLFHNKDLGLLIICMSLVGIALIIFHVRSERKD
jgi:hypothetical protein